MPQVGFEPTTLVFERATTVHPLDRAATVIRECPAHLCAVREQWVVPRQFEMSN
jgi:hypothetical protein